LSSFTTSGENARLLRIEAAKRSTAPEYPFIDSLDFDGDEAIVLQVLQRGVDADLAAKLRKLSQTIMSALLNVAMRPIMVGSIEFRV